MKYTISIVIYIISISFLFSQERDMELSSHPTTKNTITDFGTYHALLIAVSDYQDKKAIDLDGEPISDAQSLKTILKTNYTFEEKNITLLENPSHTEIIRTLYLLRKKVGKEDNLLIFYAGHGEYDEETELGYWLPADAEVDVPVNWLYNSVIVDNLKAIKSKHTLLISDACFSGSIFKARSMDKVPDSYIKKYELPSRRIITSGALKTVPNKSVFFKYLSLRLEENTNTYFSASELFAQIEIPVSNNSPNIPQFGNIQNVGHEGGDFVFILKKEAALRDSDDDGIFDDKDECPHTKGSALFKGCPDTDEDYVPDHKDKCPHIAGLSKNEGCPGKNTPIDSRPRAPRAPEKPTLSTKKDTDNKTVEELNASNQQNKKPTKPTKPTPKTNTKDPYDGMGYGFARQVERRPDISQIKAAAMGKKGTVYLEICVNRFGKVTKAEAIPSKSTIKDSVVLARMEILLLQYRYKKDMSAPSSHCHYFMMNIRSNNENDSNRSVPDSYEWESIFLD